MLKIQGSLVFLVYLPKHKIENYSKNEHSCGISKLLLLCNDLICFTQFLSFDMKYFNHSDLHIFFLCNYTALQRVIEEKKVNPIHTFGHRFEMKYLYFSLFKPNAYI